MPDFPLYPDRLEHPSWGVAHRVRRLALLAVRPPRPDPGLRPPDDLDQHFAKWGVEHLRPAHLVMGPRAPEAQRDPFNNTSRFWWLRHEHPSDESLWTTVREGIEGDDDIRHELELIGPVYEVPDHPGLGRFFCPLPDELVVTDRSLRHLEGQALDEALGAWADRLRSRFHDSLDIALARSQLLSRLGRLVVRATALESMTAFELQERMLADGAGAHDLHFHNVPLIKPVAYGPNDPDYAKQWHLPVVHVEPAWDSTLGQGVSIGIIDDGFDLQHEDLAPNIIGSGVDAATGSGSAAATSTSQWHGTEVGGVAAAYLGNAKGITGVAGRARMYLVKFDSSALQFQEALLLASESGIGVLNISYNFDAIVGFDYAGSDEALTIVSEKDILVCAGTGNGQPNPLVIGYPARHPQVMAVGGCWEDGVRWDTGSGVESHYTPGGSPWGVSVVAPAQRSDNLGLLTTSLTWAAGPYGRLTGTSAAGPQVAGVAALLRSLHPALSAVRVREIIEKTAEKPTAYDPWVEGAGFPNGSWHEEVGYGLLSAKRAVSFADVFIRDWAGDDGSEPSAPPGGDYWSDSDVRVLPNPGDAFALGTGELTRGKENLIAVQVSNRGPAVANDVGVTCRLTPAGIGLDYPADWTLVDSDHVKPALVSAPGPLAAGANGVAVFRLSAAQTGTVCAWADDGLTPTALAAVTASNDHAWSAAAFTATPAAVRKSNLARRDLSCSTPKFPSLPTLIELRLLLLRRFFGRYPKISIDISQLDPKWRVTLEAEPPPGGNDLLGPVATDVGVISVDPRTRLRVVELAWPVTTVSLKAPPARSLRLRLEVGVPAGAASGTYQIRVSAPVGSGWPGLLAPRVGGSTLTFTIP